MLSKWTESTGWKAVKIPVIKAGVGAGVLLSSVVMLQLVLLSSALDSVYGTAQCCTQEQTKGMHMKIFLI